MVIFVWNLICIKNLNNHNMLSFIALCGHHKCVDHSTCVRDHCECVTGYHGDGTYMCEGIYVFL